MARFYFIMIGLIFIGHIQVAESAGRKMGFTNSTVTKYFLRVLTHISSDASGLEPRDAFNLEVTILRRLAATPSPPSCVRDMYHFPRIIEVDRARAILITSRDGFPLIMADTVCRKGFKKTSARIRTRSHEGCFSTTLCKFGEYRVCHQLRCIYGTMKLSNVTHLDLVGGNILLDTLTQKIPRLVLFDFDVAQASGSPTTHALTRRARTFRDQWGSLVHAVNEVAQVTCGKPFDCGAQPDMLGVQTVPSAVHAEFSSKNESAFQREEDKRAQRVRKHRLGKEQGKPSVISTENSRSEPSEQPVVSNRDQRVRAHRFRRHGDGVHVAGNNQSDNSDAASQQPGSNKTKRVREHRLSRGGAQ